MSKMKWIMGICILIIGIIIGIIIFFHFKGNESNLKEEITTEAQTTKQNTSEDDLNQETETVAVIEEDAEDNMEEDVKDETEKTNELKVEFVISSSWENGDGTYSNQYDVSVVNTSGQSINLWEVNVVLEDGVSVQSAWNCEFELINHEFKIIPYEYNQVIENGKAINDIGFVFISNDKMEDFYVEGQILERGEESEYVDIPENTLENIDENNTTIKKTPTEENAVQGDDNTNTIEEENINTVPISEAGSTVSIHGQLSVQGTDLVDKSGNAFQLKGVSSHGIGWFPQYISVEAFRTLRDDWGANVIRLALYTEEYNGYCNGGNQAELESLVIKGVDACIELGMYVIVDWHILSDGDPNTNKESAKVFFGKMADRYKNYPNVIYEICNEPNGGTSWNTIKEYADELIAVIREKDQDAIILVGTPTWSQDVDLVAANPVEQSENVMYVLHFYAATHKDALRNKLKTAVAAGTPVFISEFSTCEASGNGSIDYDSAEKWKALINDYNISYVGWNLSNKAEGSALISSSSNKLSGWSTEDLSDTGKWLKEMIQGK